MKGIKFTKMQASGNDFVIIEGPLPYDLSSKSIQKICDRIYGIGADGILLLEKSKEADARMRIFNADGSEAEMCGNGARCAALYLGCQSKARNLSLQTKAGIIEAELLGQYVKIKLTDPVDLKLGMKIRALGRDYEVDYLNTGVPHAVIEVLNLNSIPVKELGRAIRHHEIFKPGGTNVDFFKAINKDHISVRTYERGVEDETMACGTGSVAAAIIAFLNCCGEPQKHPGREHKIFVKTKGREVLAVYFKFSKKKITDVWLEGKARVVFSGEYFL